MIVKMVWATAITAHFTPRRAARDTHSAADGVQPRCYTDVHSILAGNLVRGVKLRRQEVQPCPELR
jgi:hypothetical protein